MFWLRLHFPGSSLSASKDIAWMKQKAVSVHKSSFADCAKVNYSLGLSNISVSVAFWLKTEKDPANSWRWSYPEKFTSWHVLSFDVIRCRWVEILGGYVKKSAPPTPSKFVRSECRSKEANRGIFRTERMIKKTHTGWAVVLASKSCTVHLEVTGQE